MSHPCAALWRRSQPIPWLRSDRNLGWHCHPSSSSPSSSSSPNPARLPPAPPMLWDTMGMQPWAHRGGWAHICARLCTLRACNVHVLGHDPPTLGRFWGQSSMGHGELCLRQAERGGWSSARTRHSPQLAKTLGHASTSCTQGRVCAPCLQMCVGWRGRVWEHCRGVFVCLGTEGGLWVRVHTSPRADYAHMCACTCVRACGYVS